MPTATDPDTESHDEAVSRRDFLRVGSLSVVGLSAAEQSETVKSRGKADRRSCILVLMTGGASQLDTFDPKPDAPSEVRGPMKAVSSAVPGIALSESLPGLAERANRFAIVRTLWHDAAPIHETGLQLLQTGRLSQGETKYPSFGSVVAKFRGPRRRVAPHVVLPHLLGNTGVNTYRGQGPGFLGDGYAPLTAVIDERDAPAKVAKRSRSGNRISLSDVPEKQRRPYGETRFGTLCLLARQLIEGGVRVVTVNLFDSLENDVTWDCHGRTPPNLRRRPGEAGVSRLGGTVYDYRDYLCPQFDRAMSALLDDLQEHGMLDDTLVVAVGEFGRTPRLNANGGRDHWTRCWSALVAGAGVRGGLVIGASDSTASEPAERPVALAELTATTYDRLELPPTTLFTADSEPTFPICEHAPIAELFA